AASQGGAGGDVAVTPGYAPIEQYHDEAQGPWTDLYSLGATLYWMVSGKAPAGADVRHASGEPLGSAQALGAGRYSEPFLAAVDWALQLEARDRPRHLDEWRAALFAAHASSLGLQEALRASDAAAGAGAPGGGRSRRAARRIA